MCAAVCLKYAIPMTVADREKANSNVFLKLNYCKSQLPCALNSKER